LSHLNPQGGFAAGATRFFVRMADYASLFRPASYSTKNETGSFSVYEHWKHGARYALSQESVAIGLRGPHLLDFDRVFAAVRRDADYLVASVQECHADFKYLSNAKGVTQMALVGIGPLVR
jgi:hypothetical protein